MDAKTRKMPVSLSFGGFKSERREFVIPFLERVKITNGFMGIESGNKVPFGTLVYIGKQISADDIVRRVTSSTIRTANKSIITKDLNTFIEKIQAFKIGNVLEIEYSPDGSFTLVKVAERPPSEKGLDLP